MGQKKRGAERGATGRSVGGTGVKGEETARRSEEKLRSILENSADILYRQNFHTGIYDYISPSMTRTLGYTPEEVMALGVEGEKELFHPDDLPGLLSFRDDLLAADLAGQRSIEREFRIRHKNGQYRWVHGNYLLTRNAGGEPDFVVGALRDVTDDRHAREALRTSERRFRELIEQSPIGMVIFDPEGRPTYVNPAHRQVIDADPEELELLKAYYNIFEDRQLAEGGLMPLVKRGFAGEPIELPATRYDPKRIDPRAPADREPLWLSGFVFPLKDSCGGVREVVVTFQDVTESKRAEEALRSAREDWQRTFDAMPDLVAILDNEHRIVRVNKAMANTLGIAPEDAVGGRCYRHVHGTDEPPPDCPHSKLCLDGNEHTAEVYEESLGAHFLVTATPLPEPGSPPTRSVHVARNITDRKRAEEALRKAQEQYRELFEGAVEGILVAQGERICFSNPAWQRMIGYDEETLTSAGFVQFIHPDDRELVLDRYRRRISGEDVPTGYDFRIVTADNEMRWVRIRSSVIDWQGEKATLNFLIDITERKRAEEERSKLEVQIRHTQKLESLGVLAGGIAHDFNNLLMGIVGNADLALMDLSPVSPARDYIRSIQSASGRLADLAKQMLAYSGKGQFVMGPIDLCDLVAEMGHLVGASISKKTTLKCALAPGIPAVDADATQVRQIVMNLVTNASEALGEEVGVVTLATGVTDCDRAYLEKSRLHEKCTEGKYVYIEVSDTGCGMDGETLANIFDPFFTTKFTGRGLGLSAVLGIVRGHKGAIMVESELGQGATFRVLLPATAKPLDRTEREGTASVKFEGTGAILLVDDEETVRVVTRRLLEKAGLTVLVAAHGRQALEVFRQRAGEIACVLLDLTMPGMDGEEVFREMRAISDDVPVVLSSGYDKGTIVQRFEGTRLVGFIQKPYHYDELIATLKRALGE